MCGGGGVILLKCLQGKYGEIRSARGFGMYVSASLSRWRGGLAEVYCLAGVWDNQAQRGLCESLLKWKLQEKTGAGLADASSMHLGTALLSTSSPKKKAMPLLRRKHSNGTFFN